MVDHINKTRACHVLTIEQPLELVHESQRAQITHREVGLHASTFAAAIRSAGRENPDVVLIGELRSAEEIKLALELASYGVLVLASLSSSGVASAIEHIVSSFPPDGQPYVRGLLADTLAGLVIQQLVPTADGKGRLAVYDVVVGSPAVCALVREGKPAQLTNLMQAGQAQGMQTMDTALERLLTDGRISAEDAIDRAVDREAFTKVIARIRPDLAERIG
jgi:twitching motility protein PilT